MKVVYKILLVVSLIFPSVLRAQNRFGLAVIQNSTRYESAGQAATSIPEIGIQATLEVSKSGFKGWEHGVILLNRGWETNSKAAFIEFPVTYNYWIHPLLGFGFGIYGAYGLGSVQLANQSMTFDAAYLNRWDYGVHGSVKINLPLAMPEGMHVHLEYKYQKGLAEMSTETTNQKRFSDSIFLVGLKIGSLGFTPDKSQGPKGRGRSTK